MNYFISIDIGTTHIKTAVYNEHGNNIALFKENTKTIKDDYGDLYCCKYVMDTVYKQIADCQKCCDKISGIAITGMAESGLVINRQTKKEITNIYPWFDLRSLKISKEYLENNDKYSEKDIYLITGLKNSHKYGIYKYLWAIENLSVEKDETTWLSICDYVAFKLTGVVATEPTFAVRTLLFDVKSKSWSDELINYFGIKKESLPKVFKTGEIIGYYNDIPVAICGHDHLCCTYGLNINEDALCNSMGTAETYISVENEVDAETLFDKGLVFGPFVDNNKFFTMANLVSSGGSVEWFRNRIQKNVIEYQELTEMISSFSEPTGILYYPFLTGAGTPYFKNDVSASFIGLKNFHDKNDLAKSVIEGISYFSKHILEVSFSDEKTKIICIGGAVNCRPWLEIKANIINRTLFSTKEKEGALFGAVKLMVDCNYMDINFPSIEYVQDYKIDEKMSKKYNEIYEKKYLKLLQTILTINE